MKVKRLFSALIACSLITIFPQFYNTNANADNKTEIDIWDGSIDTFWYNEKDTEFDITTAEELAGLAKLVNSGNSFEGKTINIVNDIYLNDISNVEDWYDSPPANVWSSIGRGSEDNSFSGIINGHSNSIIGLYTEYSEAQKWCGGLIAYASENATIKNINIGKGLAKGQTYVGALISKANSSKISNCKNYCNVLCKIDLKPGSETYAGSLTGIGGDIENCANYGSIKNDYTIASGSHSSYFSCAYAGGITSSGRITNCYNYGSVESICIDKPYIAPHGNTSYLYWSRAGGIAAVNSTIFNCYNCGFVTSSGANASMGGIIGYLSDSKYEINSSYNVGELIKKDLNNEPLIGAIIGSCSDEIKRNNEEIRLNNVYYLNTISDKGIGNLPTDSAIKVNKKTIKSQEFANVLGKYFMYSEESYPKLTWENGIFINMGDVNDDGSISVADLVMLQKYVLGSGVITNWRNADLCEDECLNCFDVILMRRLLFDKTIE